MWQRVKSLGNKPGKMIPESVRMLITLKSDEERKAYLESLPSESLTALLKWVTYVVLAGDVLEKATKVGIAVPGQVRDYFAQVQAQVNQAGKITRETVSDVVEALKATIATAVIIAVICFGAFLILNPAIAGALLLSSLLVEAAFYMHGMMELEPSNEDQ